MKRMSLFHDQIETERWLIWIVLMLSALALVFAAAPAAAGGSIRTVALSDQPASDESAGHPATARHADPPSLSNCKWHPLRELLHNIQCRALGSNSIRARVHYEGREVSVELNVVRISTIHHPRRGASISVAPTARERYCQLIKLTRADRHGTTLRVARDCANLQCARLLG
jgi:hypothetical protein